MKKKMMALIAFTLISGITIASDNNNKKQKPRKYPKKYAIKRPVPNPACLQAVQKMLSTYSIAYMARHSWRAFYFKSERMDVSS